MSMRKALLKIYWASQRFIIPSFKSSESVYAEFLPHYVTRHTRWLDLGCGRSILPRWRKEVETRLVTMCRQIVGIDYDFDSIKSNQGISAKVRGNVTQLPFKNDAFDLITANMVVEHLDTPRDQFLEISRIMKPKGLFLFHTPNVFGYGVLMARVVPNWLKNKLIYLLEEREERDVFETYYRANSEKRIHKLARACGFEVVKIEMLVSDACFASIPPLFVPELIWIRMLMTKPLRSLRTNIITILQKV
jgi:ubiquinone/menaquinone biosynthesis C-methylase UbiE